MSNPSDLKNEIELFLLAHPDADIHDRRAGMVEGSNAHYAFEERYGKLFLEIWTSDLSLTRRVLGIRVHETDFMALRVSFGAFPEFDLEIDARRSFCLLRERKAARRKFLDQMTRLLESQRPGLRLERLRVSKDLSRSFSEHYCRGWGREDNRPWAVFGVNPAESQATIDAGLGYALIWLDHLRLRLRNPSMAGLLLLVPEGSSGPLLTRIAFLRAGGAQLEICEYDRDMGVLNSMDPRDFGNLSTKLSRVDRVPLPRDEIPMKFLPAPIRNGWKDFEFAHRPASHLFSVRFHGLEFAQLAEERNHKIHFGVAPIAQPFFDGREDELERLIQDLKTYRCPDSPDISHPYFRLQAERWMESLVLSDIRMVHGSLDPRFVYPQVPAFSGTDRAVIDILTVTRSRRLAVVELKVAEDINLPLQALDYWARVKWHQDRGDFRSQGYFQEISVGDELPLLFLVCPAFRYHSTTDMLLRCFPREIQVIKVGVNENWREGIQVLYRR